MTTALQSLADPGTLPAILGSLLDDGLVTGMDRPDPLRSPATTHWSIERRPQPPADGAPR